MVARPDVADTVTARHVDLPVELLKLVYGVDTLAALERRIDDVLESSLQPWDLKQHGDAWRSQIMEALARCHELVKDGWDLYGDSEIEGAVGAAACDVIGVSDLEDAHTADTLASLLADVIDPPPSLSPSVTAPLLELRPNPRAVVLPLIRRARARASHRRSSVTVSSTTSTTNDSRDGQPRLDDDDRPRRRRRRRSDSEDSLGVVVDSGVLA